VVDRQAVEQAQVQAVRRQFAAQAAAHQAGSAGDQHSHKFPRRKWQERLS
jgi:hypothetical protein